MLQKTTNLNVSIMILRNNVFRVHWLYVVIKLISVGIFNSSEYFQKKVTLLSGNIFDF